MDKIKKIVDGCMHKYVNQDNPAYAALEINLVFLFFILLFCKVVFETNDDSGMASIAYGAATDRYSMHLIFINCFIGAVLKILLSIMPFIPWYTVVMYLVLFISYSTISYCMMKKNFKWGAFLHFVIIIFFGYYTYTSLQFTEAAAVSTIAGIMLMFQTVYDVEVKKGKFFLAMLLLLFGAAYRFEMFCAVFIVMSGYGLYQAAVYYHLDKKKLAIRSLAFFCFSILLCFGIEFIDRYEYARNSLYKEYTVFNTYRAELMDHGFPDYEEHQEVYEELGISEEDLQLYASWDFADPDVFKTEALAALVEVKNEEKETVGFEFLSEFFEWFPKEFLRYRWISAYLFICFLSIIWNYKNIKWIFAELLLIGCLQFYFFYSERYLQGRVDIGLFLAASVVVSGVMLDRISERIKVGLAVFSIVLVLVPIWYQDNKFDENNVNIKEKAEQFSTVVSEDKEKLYLCSVPSAGTYANAYGVWDIVPCGFQSNISPLGGWGTNAPFSQYVLNVYQVGNPFRDVVDNPNIYLIDNYHINEIVAYIQRHYNENAYARLVKQVDGASIYHIVTGEVQLEGLERALVPDGIKKKIKVVIQDKQLLVDGYAYIKGSSSYQGNAYVLLEDSDGNQVRYQMLQQENEKQSQDTDGKYSKYIFADVLEEQKSYNIKVFYEHSGSLYCIGEADHVKAGGKKKIIMK